MRAKSQTGVKGFHYPQKSPSLVKLGAWMHSLPELRQDMDCAENAPPPPPAAALPLRTEGGQKAKSIGKSVKSHPGVWTPTPLRVASLTL